MSEPGTQSPMGWHAGGVDFWGVLWRIALITGVLGLLAMRFGEQFVEGLLPLFKREIAWLDDTFRVDRMYLDQDGPDRVIRVEVGLAHRLELNGHVVNPDPRGEANASTLAGHVIVPAILASAIAFAWPTRTRTAYAQRALALVPALMLLWMIDVPLILLASLWGLILQSLDPGRFSGLWMWSAFLQGGGELAMAVILGMLIGALISIPERRTG